MIGIKKTIAHIHVWDRTNKGDLAIVLAVQELLKKKFPGCRIINFPIEVLKEYNAKKISLINSADFVVIGGGGILYRYFLCYKPPAQLGCVRLKAKLYTKTSPAGLVLVVH